MRIRTVLVGWCFFASVVLSCASDESTDGTGSPGSDVQQDDAHVEAPDLGPAPEDDTAGVDADTSEPEDVTAPDTLADTEEPDVPTGPQPGDHRDLSPLLSEEEGHRPAHPLPRADYQSHFVR